MSCIEYLIEAKEDIVKWQERIKFIDELLALLNETVTDKRQ